MENALYVGGFEMEQKTAMKISGETQKGNPDFEKKRKRR